MTMELEPTQTVSVVVPVFNEAENLPVLIRRCVAACRELTPFELVLVDDGSSDGSDRIITEAAQCRPDPVVGVFFNRNYGQHAAVLAGFAVARGDLVVTLDADLQNPPEEIPRIVTKLREGFDVVGGVRLERQDPLSRRLASFLVNRFTARETGVPMTDYGCMLRGYRRRIVDAILECRERSTFVPVLANSFARRATEIPVAHAARSKGRSKYSAWTLFNLQLDLVTSMTKLPLRLVSILGALISVLGAALGVLLLVLRLFYGSGWSVNGVFTLFAVLFLLCGVQLVGMGLLGEYLGRIYDDVRARPRYFVHRVVGHTDLELKESPPRRAASRVSS
jgi:undecaprenyl-phosphate 4-deoxy-4-formamido-L-arabinose transferase